MAVEKFTFYPSDWQSSQKVFELNLEERGFYFELIQIAYKNGGDVNLNFPLFARLFNSDIQTLKKICRKLFVLGLLEKKRNTDRNTVRITNVFKRLSKSDKARKSVEHRWEQERNTVRNTNIKYKDKEKKVPKKSLSERRLDFSKSTLTNFGNKYSAEILKDFIGYWTEAGPKDSKMRFEKQKSFDPKRRIATWIKNQKQFAANKPQKERL